MPGRDFCALPHKKSKCPRRFWETDPEMLHTCSICPFRGFYQCFFFQAEDGIRDRSPSRGLGDVYKRQVSPYREPLQAYSILSPLFPSGSNVHAVFERDPAILCTCWMCPCRALYEWIGFIYLFIFDHLLGFCIFGGIWVLRDPTFPATRKKSFLKGSAGAH